MTSYEAIAKGEEQEKIALKQLTKEFAIGSILAIPSVPIFYYQAFKDTHLAIKQLILTSCFCLIAWGMHSVQWRNSEQYRNKMVQWYLCNTPQERAIYFLKKMLVVIFFILILVVVGWGLYRITH